VASCTNIVRKVSVSTGMAGEDTTPTAWRWIAVSNDNTIQLPFNYQSITIQLPFNGTIQLPLNGNGNGNWYTLVTLVRGVDRVDHGHVDND
jgi:hypothetical protein